MLYLGGNRIHVASAWGEDCPPSRRSQATLVANTKKQKAAPRLRQSRSAVAEHQNFHTLMKIRLNTHIAALCAFLSSLAFAAPMSDVDFTQHFVQEATTSLSGVQFSIVGKLHVHSKDMNGYELDIFLNNGYSQYTSSPGNLKAIIDQNILSIKSQHLALASKSRGLILAVLKPSDYLANVKKQLAQTNLAGKDIPFVFDKINDDLYCFYVFDAENGMVMVTQKDLDERKIDAQSIRSIAIQNLSKYFDKNGVSIRRLERTGDAKVFAVSLDENYEASILLLQKYWSKKTFNVTGDIVAFVPARNVVIVTGSKDKEGIRIATHIAEAGFKELGYAISPRGYKYELGTWKPFTP